MDFYEGIFAEECEYKDIFCGKFLTASLCASPGDRRYGYYFAQTLTKEESLHIIWDFVRKNKHLFLFRDEKSLDELKQGGFECIDPMVFGENGLPCERPNDFAFVNKIAHIVKMEGESAGYFLMKNIMFCFDKDEKDGDLKICLYFTLVGGITVFDIDKDRLETLLRDVGLTTISPEKNELYKLIQAKIELFESERSE